MPCRVCGCQNEPYTGLSAGTMPYCKCGNNSATTSNTMTAPHLHQESCQCPNCKEWH